MKIAGRARRGQFQTAHGLVQTPVFMNVGTAGAIKGAVDAFDLRELGCQVELSTPITCMCAPAMRSSARWAAYTGSCVGTAQC